jgi:hypothetical protein
MRVFVLISIRRDPHVPYPPSVWHLQHRARQAHERSFRATTAAFLWSRDALFQSLHRVSVEQDRVHGSSGTRESTGSRTPRFPSSHLFWFFTAMMDVGGCEDEVGVVSMIVRDLCRAWPGAAAHVEVCRTPHKNVLAATTSQGNVANSVEREEALLLQLADAVEADARTQEVFQHRWGVDTAWDYTDALHGRCWWGESGYVAVLPKDVSAVVDYFLSRELMELGLLKMPLADLQPTCDVEAILEVAFQTAVLERSLTEHFDYLMSGHFVPQRLYSGAFHQAVVAVPPSLALFLAALPSCLLHDCVLFHAVDRALSPFVGHPAAATKARNSGSGLACSSDLPDNEEVAALVVMPAVSPNLFLSSLPAPQSTQDRYDVAFTESQQLAELFNEYDILLSNNGAVRMPLPPMSRYVFALLLCQCELPSTLMAPFIRRHATTIATMQTEERSFLSSSAGNRHRRTPFTEEEVVLGMKVTWAVQRWTAALRAGDTTAPLPYPLWHNSVARLSEAYHAWVRNHMQYARRYAEELLSEKGGVAADVPLDAATAAFPVGSPHHRNLWMLEDKLFAPRPLTFRGSTTDWVGNAVREVGEQYAKLPASLLVAEETEAEFTLMANLEEESSPASAEPRFMQHYSDEAVGTSSSTESEEEGEGGVAVSDAGDGVDESETLLAQMDELEEVLKREMQLAYNPEKAPEVSSDEDYPWLSEADVTSVTQNEQFLNHVQLLGAELAAKR